MESGSYEPMEQLKPIEEIAKPDLRSTAWVTVSKKTGGTSPITLKDHYEAIQRFQLHSEVPEEIVSHFATAQNLLLYTWYAYGFYPVAEQHVLTTLEYALRERIGGEGLQEIKQKKLGRNGLHTYIKFAIEKKWIKNEDFSAYHRAPRKRAEYEFALQKNQEMKDKGLTSMAVDYSDVEVPEINDTDFLGILLEYPNKIRNNYAHGTFTLHPNVWYTFELCSEFINKIFLQEKRELFNSF